MSRRLRNLARVSLVWLATASCGQPALATDYTVAPGATSTSAISAAGTDTVTVGGKLSVNKKAAVDWNNASTNLKITNSGTIESTKSGGRAIDTSGSDNARSLTLENRKDGIIKADDDAVRITVNPTGGTITVNNAGTIQSSVGQALDFEKAARGAATITINNAATGTIKSDGEDAIRPGQGATINNAGSISAAGGTGTKNDGVDFKDATAGTINNTGSGTISGARHGVTLGGTGGTGSLTVSNAANATITGRSGSGVGSDAGGTVTNYGTIEGAYSGTGPEDGDGDGDGVDIDFAGTVTNYGTIKGTGAGGYDKGGRANNSEGISLGGGTITNSGTISGAAYGIVVNNDSNPDNSRSGVAATTITNDVGGTIKGERGYAIRLENKTGTAADNDTIVNRGTIIGNGTIPDPTAIVHLKDGSIDGGSKGTLDGLTYTGTGSARFIRGDGAAIQMGEGSDSLSNYGTIIGNNGRAISLEGGDDTLSLYTGSAITGRIDGGAGTDTINLDKAPSGTGTLANAIHFELLNVRGGTWTLLDDQTYANGATVSAGATLRIGNGTTGGSIAADIANDGSLVFDRTDATSYAGTISGTGNLTKVNTGALTLMGANTHTGATVVSGGTLRAGATGTFSAASAVTVAAGATLDLAGFDQRIGSLAGAGQVTLGAGMLRAGADNSSTTFSGPIAGGGGLGKEGAGTLTLTGANTYTGTTTISGGTLAIRMATALGAADGTAATGTTVADGATLALQGGIAVGNEALNIAGLGLGNGGALRSVSGDNSYAGAITLTADSRITADAGTLTLTGTIGGTSQSVFDTWRLTLGGAGDGVIAGAIGSGIFGLTKDGTGIWTSTGASTVEADTTVRGGVLRIAAGGTMSDAFGTVDGAGGRTAAVTVTGTNSRWTNSNGLTVGAAGTGTLTLANGGAASSSIGTIGSAARSSGMVAVTGANSSWINNSNLYVGQGGTGTLTITDGGAVSDVNGYIGNSAGSSGIVTVAGNKSRWTSDTGLIVGYFGVGTVSVAEGATVSVTRGALTLAQRRGSAGTLNIGAAAGQTAVTAGTVAAGEVTFGAGTGTLTFNHTGNPDGSAVTFAPTITGAGRVNQLAGTTILTGANTYTGETTVTAGTLSAANATALGTSATTVTAGGTLNVNGVTLANTLTLAGTGAGGVGALTGTGTAGVSGAIMLAGNTALGGSGTLTASGTIGDGGNGYGLSKVGTGTTILTAANTYTGGTTVAGGTLSAAHAAALGTGTATVTARSTLNVNGVTLANALTLAGTGAGGTGALTGTGTAGISGPVTLAGNTTLGGGGTLTVSGAIGDGGNRYGLTKLDTGTAILTAANTYTGGTTVTGGILALSGAGTLGSTGASTAVTGATAVLDLGGTRQIQAAVTLSDGATVQNGALDTALTSAGGTLARISGTASLTTRAGTTLSIGNSYTGPTTVGDGSILRAGGAGGFSARSALTLAGTLDLAGTSNSVGSLAGTAAAANVTSSAAGPAVLTVAGLGAGTFAGTIRDGAGPVGLTLAGTAPLTLTGANTYTGATTINPGATLRLGDGGTAGAITGTSRVTNDGTLVFDRADAVTFAPAISGTGRLTQAGIGRTVLTGHNTYTGPTTVSGGILQIDGVLSASDVTVRRGGTLAGTGKIGDPLIEAGGTLAPGGATTLGTLSIHGPLTFAPGSFYAVRITPTANDRTTVTGPVTIQGGTVQVQAGAGTYTPALHYTLLSATGGVTGRFTSLQTTSNLAFLTPSLVYDATGVALAFAQTAPITGAATTPNQGGVARALNGVGPTVTTTATPTPATPTTAAPTTAAPTPATPRGPAAGAGPTTASAGTKATRPSTVAVSAGTVTGTVSTATGSTTVVASPAAQVATAVLNQTAPGAVRALNSLSGEVQGSAVTAQAQTAFATQDVIFEHLRFGAGTGPAGGGGLTGTDSQRFAPGTTLPASYAAFAPDEPAISLVPVRPLAPRYAIWGQAFGAFGSTDATRNTGHLTRQTGGFVFGAETGPGVLDDGAGSGLADWRVGVAGGYSVTQFDMTARQSSGRIESGFGGAYARGALGPVQVRLGSVYSGDALDTRRTVLFPGFSQAISGRASGSTLQGFGEVGYRIGGAAGYIEPFVGGAALRLHRDGFTETGGSAALAAFGRSYRIEMALAGVQAQAVVADLFGGAGPLRVRGLIGYRRAFGDVTPAALLAFRGGGTAFRTAGAPLARDAALVSAGLDWDIAVGTLVGLTYDGQLGRRTQDHALKGTLSYHW